MRVLIVLTYYQPYTSGLTIYALREARALARRGHKVQVLTSQHDQNLPADETIDGVDIRRSKVWFRIGKGLVMPEMWLNAIGLVRKADAVNLHLPQLDAAPVALIARLMSKRVVITYHCDLVLPKGSINRIANWVSNMAASLAAGMAHVIVQNSRDYAEHSPFLKRYLKKVRAIAPPVEVRTATDEQCRAFRKRYELATGSALIGMAGRLASEKGVEVAAEAFLQVLQGQPNACILFAGPYQNVPGEEAYARRVMPLVEKLGEHWKFLGKLPDEEMGAFFAACDVLLVPSINSTESYGLVQVEAMSCGTPVIASDLPGVRVPVGETGMGEVARRGDSDALAKAILRVLADPGRYQGDPSGLVRKSDPDRVAEEYEKLLAGE